MPQGTFHANSPRIILIKLIHRFRCDMYADMRVEQMNRIRVNISALDALVLGLDEISLFLVLVGIKCGNYSDHGHFFTECFTVSSVRLNGPIAQHKKSRSNICTKNLHFSKIILILWPRSPQMQKKVC